jgi:hypothetical protein
MSPKIAFVIIIVAGLASWAMLIPEKSSAQTKSFGSVPGVVINEIMFAPVSPEPEWIELLNTTPDSINIAGWVLSVRGHAPVAIPSTNAIIPPDSLIVLSSKDTELAAIRDVDIERIIRISLPDLNNTGSTIALNDSLGDLIDSAWYSGKWIKSDGISIERIDPAVIGYDSTNWSACKDPSGSTILRPNSVRKRAYDLALTNAYTSDTSISVTLVNVGLDTVKHTSLIMQIGTFAPMLQDLMVDLPSNHSLVVSIPLPDNFYGLFPVTLFIQDSLDLNPANDSLRSTVTVPIPMDSVVINEIMFDPLVSSCQWLEVYNLSGKWISMDSTRLITGESKPSEYSHAIPPLTITPDSFGIITANDSIYTTYPALTGRSGITQVGSSTLDLGKDSCFVVLHNRDSSTVDSVHYNKSWQQSLLKKSFVGISLERKDPRAESNDPQNWHASLDSATPLATNSVDTSDSTNTPAIGTVFKATFSPNPFSPDGDGFEDVSTLTIQTGTSGSWAMQVRIYDARGRIVRTLANATAVLGASALTFDGKRDNGQTLPPGLYTVLVEITSQSPAQSLKQETGVIIAGKRR